jgi:hypothetical protein
MEDSIHGYLDNAERANRQLSTGMNTQPVTPPRLLLPTTAVCSVHPHMKKT